MPHVGQYDNFPFQMDIFRFYLKDKAFFSSFFSNIEMNTIVMIYLIMTKMML